MKRLSALLALLLASLFAGGCAARMGGAGTPIRLVASRRALATAPAIRASLTRTPAPPTDITAVASAGGRVWALAVNPAEPFARARLLLSSDGGQSFQPRGTLPAATTGIDFPTAQVGFAWSGKELLRSDDGGRTWAAIAQSDFAEVRFASAQDGIAVFADGRLATSGDGGRSWQAALGSTGLSFRSAFALPGPRFWALGFTPGSWASRSVLWRRAGGGPWQTVFDGVAGAPVHHAYLAYLRAEFPTTPPAYDPKTFGQGGDVWFMTPEVGYVALFDGGQLATMVLRTANGGRSWTYAWGNAGCAMGCSAAGESLYPMAFFGPQQVWRIDGYALDRSQDGGRTFTKGGPLRLGLSTSQTVRGAAFLSPNLGILGTVDGIWRTTDGGTHWTRAWPKAPGPSRASR